ncbi:MAG TPA: (2Fe-2S)-binding protein [Pseudolabrys sp.]|jgi:carbon-monoxide dehydrogenase small subunit|nr:(2Fe-2S)-binding protein [Pseudolabrys sp.]
MTSVSLILNINGAEVATDVEPRETLADVLRERLTMTATHVGCEHGACGACSVEVDGKIVRSCLMLGVMAEGRGVVTLEGLGDDPIIAVLRRTFHEKHAVQCGFCTPGMLMMARDLLKNGHVTSERDVRDGMAGQICRCTGYTGIVRAILAAAEELRRTSAGAPASA